MKDETREWLTYAEDNLSSAEILLSHRLWNPSLQNCQQAVDMLDSIYISSKYPAGNALPDFAPDEPVCQKCIEIARAARDAAGRHLAVGERGLD